MNSKDINNKLHEGSSKSNNAVFLILIQVNLSQISKKKVNYSTTLLQILVFVNKEHIKIALPLNILDLNKAQGHNMRVSTCQKYLAMFCISPSLDRQKENAVLF